MDEQLMVVTQLPQFQENLHAIKSTLEDKGKEALSLAETEENLPVLKEKRAELNKIRKELDAQWKAVYTQAMAPIEAFKAVYKECVPDVLSRLVEKLADKLDIEGLDWSSAELISGCTERNGHLYEEGERLDKDGLVDDLYYCTQYTGYSADYFSGTLYFKTNVPGQFVAVPFEM